MVAGSKHRRRLFRNPRLSPSEKFLRLYMQNPAIWCIVGRKMVRNAVHNALLNTLTMGTAFLRIPPRNDPWPGIIQYMSSYANDLCLTRTGQRRRDQCWSIPQRAGAHAALSSSSRETGQLTAETCTNGAINTASNGCLRFRVVYSRIYSVGC